ncbi:hypothetical protein POSPLADRAFT_1147841 [Postia placenta MAD-698-R-SB12]|uniref:Uncharacterized protein n=1 Tax=Postia placenta MAD-698-R-SB12 TaxID=670580 RepID=A0A1X6MV59_9APHY|nr:hypothetical protein POSPLADRAFT_1147841 [Postia placenta MAD-698-R-SB12]OSX60264.1 hypothetical protein POSPLADRAFT_1147841 [Postia placenta MAD-698-R-SB12]
MASTEGKMALPAFLQVLTKHGVPPSRAIAVAGKIYKTHNTPSQLSKLTDSSLKAAGVDDQDTRKLVLAALRKAGYKATPGKPAAGTSRAAMQGTPGGAGSSISSTSTSAERPRKKRKRDDDLNEFLPDRHPEEGEQYGSLEFNELLDEQVLQPKYMIVNRAPIMMAWAFVVAERLGFHREEALSIASVYTEMNAITKGVSLGVFDKNRGKGVEASSSGSQPYVDLMGRRPLYQTASGSWRALSSGTPIVPTSAFSYITRALRQTAPAVLGALRLLAASYTPAELNRTGFALYQDFRPDVDGWGGRGEVRCATILALRRTGVKEERPEERGGAEAGSAKPLVKIEQLEGDSAGPSSKRPRAMTLEEYEAALDADDSFANLDLSNIP